MTPQESTRARCNPEVSDSSARYDATAGAPARTALTVPYPHARRQEDREAMAATAQSLASSLPPMPGGPIDGPDAWRADEMRERDDWVHVLSEAEIVEIEVAVEAADIDDRPIVGIGRDDFHLPGLDPVLDAVREELLRGRGFVLIRGPADRALVGAPARDRVLGDRRPVRSAGDAERDGSPARPRHRSRPDQRRLAHPHLSDQRPPVLPRRLLRHRRPALRPQGEARRTQRDSELRDPPQRDARPLAGAGRGAVPAPALRPAGARCRKASLRGTRCRCSTGTRAVSAPTTSGATIQSIRRLPEVPPLTERQIAAFDLLDEIAEDPAVQLRMDFEPGDMQFPPQPPDSPRPHRLRGRGRPRRTTPPSSALALRPGRTAVAAGLRRALGKRRDRQSRRHGGQRRRSPRTLEP